MAEFEINGIKYRSTAMDAMRQFNVVRRLAPILDSVKSMLDMKLEDGLGIIAQAISKISDADAEYVISSCMSVVTREQAGGTGWAKVWSIEAQKPMFTDIDMAVMLRIVFVVVGEAIIPFFGALPSTSKA